MADIERSSQATGGLSSVRRATGAILLSALSPVMPSGPYTKGALKHHPKNPSLPGDQARMAAAEAKRQRKAARRSALSRAEGRT